MQSPHHKFLTLGHGKTAPWIDLVNSEEWDTFGNPSDHLHDPTWVPYYLKQWQFRAPAQSVSLAKLKSLRTTLRKSCESITSGEQIAESQLRECNSAMNVVGKRQLFQRQNGLRVEFVPTKFDWNWIIAEIAQSFADMLAGGEIARVKICRNDDCKWVFYDKTKGRTRCWCSGQSCGNRERVRRARSKKSK
jgi:predicted RNA-binding Zn ribbon-like protein